MICYTPRSLVKHFFYPHRRLTGPFSTFLISTAIANQAKRNFYEEDVPKVEDVGLMLISSRLQVFLCIRIPQELRMLHALLCFASDS